MKEPTDQNPPEKEPANIGGLLDELPDNAFGTEDPFGEPEMPQGPAPGVEHLKPKLQAFLELTRTKLDIESVRSISTKISAQMEGLLQKGGLRQAFRQEPGEYTPLKQITSYRVASPCFVRWDQMDGEDKQRICKRCSRRVYDLSELDDSEGQALVQKAEGKIDKNIVLFKRTDGKFLSGDCPVGQQRKILLLLPYGLGFLVLVSIFALPWMIPSNTMVPTLPSKPSQKAVLHNKTILTLVKHKTLPQSGQALTPQTSNLSPHSPAVKKTIVTVVSHKAPPQTPQPAADEKWSEKYKNNAQSAR